MQVGFIGSARSCAAVQRYSRRPPARACSSTLRASLTPSTNHPPFAGSGQRADGGNLEESSGCAGQHRGTSYKVEHASPLHSNAADNSCSLIECFGRTPNYLYLDARSGFFLNRRPSLVDDLAATSYPWLEVSSSKRAPSKRQSKPQPDRRQPLLLRPRLDSGVSHFGSHADRRPSSRMRGYTEAARSIQNRLFEVCIV